MQEVIDFTVRNIFPIVNIIVAFFVLREAYLMRRLETTPDVIYYIHNSGSNFFAVIENIGNGVAHNLNIEIEFDSEVYPPFIESGDMEGKTYKGHYSFLAPKQSLELELGWIYADHSLGGFDTHRTKLTFTKEPDNKKKIESSFQINKNQILDAKDDGNLKIIAKKLDELKSELISVASRM